MLECLLHGRAGLPKANHRCAGLPNAVKVSARTVVKYSASETKMVVQLYVSVKILKIHYKAFLSKLSFVS